jgi:hypothetical protein
VRSVQIRGTDRALESLSAKADSVPAVTKMTDRASSETLTRCLFDIVESPLV